jgi:hypothetical protein
MLELEPNFAYTWSSDAAHTHQRAALYDLSCPDVGTLAVFPDGECVTNSPAAIVIEAAYA